MEGRLLFAQSVTKRYGGNLALENVDFDLKHGEVHALMGENGAGKSTLGKIIAGVIPKDGGKLFLEGKEVCPANTRQAMDLGIAIVLQEFNLVGDLSVAENLFLNDSSCYRSGFLVDRKEMEQQAYGLLALFGMEQTVHPKQKVRNLSVAEMQVIEILKAVKSKSKVIILDEPTAALTSKESGRLFKVVETLKQQQVGMIIVSHRIEEIYAISDRITVLRDGKLVLKSACTAQLTEQGLVRAMVGREIKDLYGARNTSPERNPVALEVKGLSDRAGKVKNVSFSLKQGEVLGITGLVGAGRSELARCIFGADPSTGEVRVNGKQANKPSIRSSIKHKVALIPEDRKHQGLILNLDVLSNVSVVKTGVQQSFILDRRQEREDCKNIAERLHMKYGDARLPAGSLSGGNQQKLLLAKWLLLSPRVLIVDEPTRGVDISAKSEIYSILNRLAEGGVAILMVSSELPEIIGLCDRILVMKDGAIVTELQGRDATEEQIARFAMVGPTASTGNAAIKECWF